MDSILCDICFEEFSDDNCIPRVLECGHSFCSQCIFSILESQKTCPKCKIPLTKPSIDGYPVNFTLMNLTGCFKTHVTELNAILTLNELKKELTLKSQHLFWKIDELTAVNNVILKDLEKIHKIMDINRKGPQVNFKDVNKFIKELKDHNSKAENLSNNSTKINFQETYLLTAYRNTKQFLYDISLRIHQGETMYARELVGKEVMYGKISFDEDKVCVHALTTPSVDKNASVVLFQDLKNCISKDNFLPFIKMDTMLFFNLTNESSLALQFVKLCSGELGPTYKGSQVKYEVLQICPQLQRGRQVANTTNVSSIEKYMLNNVASEGCIDYDLSVYNNSNMVTTCIPGEVSVQMYSNGKCIISKHTQQCNFNNVVAKLKSDIKDYENFKSEFILTDCGIAFLL